MPEFTYVARDASGSSRTGSISAPSSGSAATQLRERGWIVLQVDRPDTDTRSANQESLASRLPPRGSQVEVSLQQLAMMLRSGMTLLESIQAVAEQSGRASLKRTWTKIGDDLQRGMGLSDAMGFHKCFPNFVIRLIQVGERTGNLPTVLSRAADTMKQRRMASESFISAIIYPALVVLLSIVVTAYMIVYLIPRLESYLQSLGRQMPPMTQGLIDASVWLRSNIQFVILALLLVVAAVTSSYFSKEGRRWIDQFLLQVPILGRLMRLGETTTFARGLSMMLNSGITLTDGMTGIENTLNNHHLRQTVSTARERLIRGSNLVDALKQKHAFTPLLSRMVAVGEKSGDLAGVLDEVATMSDQQFDAAVKRMNAVVTPALTLVIGGIVGYVYIAFFMALVAAGS